MPPKYVVTKLILKYAFIKQISPSTPKSVYFRAGFSRGTWEPGSHEMIRSHKISLLELPHFFTKNEGLLKRNKSCDTESNFLYKNLFPVTRRNSCQKIKICNKRKFLIQEEISGYMNNFLPQE